MASTFILSTSEKNYFHSRRKTADTLTLQNNELSEKTRYDAYGHQIVKNKQNIEDASLTTFPLKN